MRGKIKHNLYVYLMKKKGENEHNAINWVHDGNQAEYEWQNQQKANNIAECEEQNRTETYRDRQGVTIRDS